MKNRSRVTIVALAAISGLTATGILHRATAATPDSGPRQPMVVAAFDLGERHALDADGLKIMMVRERPPGAFSSVDEIKGRLPLVPVPAGQPVLSSHLAAVGEGAALADRVSPGKRAITVGINEIAGVAGFLRPGLHVDIIGVAQDSQEWRTTLVAQNVPILAVAQEDQEKSGGSAPKVATSATLLVTPDQAKFISLAAEKGRIRLALRSQDDEAIVKSAPEAIPHKPAMRAQLAHKQAAARPARQAPAKPAAAPATAPETSHPKSGIEVISGEKMEVVHP